MTSKRVEIAVGAVVLAVLALVVGGAYAGKGQPAEPGVNYTARFNRADGLPIGGEVRLSGMPVGRVTAQNLDDHFRAVVTLRLHPGLALPEDTAAVIHTEGLLGPKYIELEPGGSSRMIRPGGEITYTQDALVLQDLLESIVAQAKTRRDAQEAR